MSSTLSNILGVPANTGTPNQLFHPANYKRRVDGAYIRRKLSTEDVATLLHVDPSTGGRWIAAGKMKARRSARRCGWKKWNYWRMSMKDIEDFLLDHAPRKSHDNPVSHQTWTPQEIECLHRDICPEYRSPQACRNKKHRLRKEGRL